MPIKKGVLVPGMQEEGVCVINETTFIDANGNLLDPSESNMVWLSRDIVHETSKIRAKYITPQIVCPLSCEPLSHLYELCITMAKHKHSDYVDDCRGCAVISLSHHSRYIWLLPNSNRFW